MSKNNSVREGRSILFADGEERMIYPLTIRQLRKFMKVVKNMNAENQDISDEDIDVMVEATAIALEKVDPKLAGDTDALEDVIDVKTFNLILAAAMGADPN